MLKFLKFWLGLAMIPLAYAVSVAFYRTLSGSAGWHQLDRNSWWFLGGMGVWLVLFLLYPRPIRTYVLGHELTHALWGFLMGARVSRLRVSSQGGSVTLDKTNVLITLAPYFFPFYMGLALLIYLVVNHFLPQTQYIPFWYAVFGLTWAFHLCFTIVILGVRQPDIHEHGRIFSYVMIYVVNVTLAALLLNFLTDTPLRAFWAELKPTIPRVYRQAVQLLSEGAMLGYGWVSDFLQ